MKKILLLFLMAFGSYVSMGMPYRGGPVLIRPCLATDTTRYATLYIYRSYNFFGLAVDFEVSVNDTSMGWIKNNTKMIVKVYTEGKSVFWTETEVVRKLKLDIKFGQEYFIKCELVMGIMEGRPRLTLMPPEKGRIEFDKINIKNQMIVE